MFRPSHCSQVLLVVAALLSSAPSSVNADTAPEWENGADDNGEAAPPSSDSSATLAADAVDESVDPSRFEPAPMAAAPTLTVDARLAALDGYLAEIEAPTRRYFAAWSGLQIGLVFGQVGLAYTSDSKAHRTSYFIGAGMSALSFGLFVVSPRPGMRAARRFRAMPAQTASEKQDKLAAGELELEKQAEADRRATSWSRHLIGIGAALGSGAAVVLIHDHSLKLAAQRVFLTFLVTELQILSRPQQAMRNFERYFGRKVGAEVAFSPMFDRYTQGVSLNARF